MLAKKLSSSTMKVRKWSKRKLLLFPLEGFERKKTAKAISPKFKYLIYIYIIFISSKNVHLFYWTSVFFFFFFSTVAASADTKQLVGSHCSQVEEILNELDCLKAKLANSLRNVQQATEKQDGIVTNVNNLSLGLSRGCEAVGQIMAGHVEMMNKENLQATEAVKTLKTNVSYFSFCRHVSCVKTLTVCQSLYYNISPCHIHLIHSIFG